MKIICPATGNEINTEYCGGNCITCSWTVKTEPPEWCPLEDKEVKEKCE